MVKANQYDITSPLSDMAINISVINDISLFAFFVCILDRQQTLGVGDMCCLFILNSVTSTRQWIRQPKPHVYLPKGTYPDDTKLFRGPSTNDMKR